jgi:hypothetical protein
MMARRAVPERNRLSILVVVGHVAGVTTLRIFRGPSCDPIWIGDRSAGVIEIGFFDFVATRIVGHDRGLAGKIKLHLLD